MSSNMKEEFSVPVTGEEITDTICTVIKVCVTVITALTAVIKFVSIIKGTLEGFCNDVRGNEVSPPPKQD